MPVVNAAARGEGGGEGEGARPDLAGGEGGGEDDGHEEHERGVAGEEDRAVEDVVRIVVLHTPPQ
eukprot:145700-Rhodomonas_salina.1